jgi:hypothetical protein
VGQTSSDLAFAATLLQLLSKITAAVSTRKYRDGLHFITNFLFI